MQHQNRHGILQLIYTIKFCKICFTQAFLRVFNVNHDKILKVYTIFHKFTQALLACLHIIPCLTTLQDCAQHSTGLGVAPSHFTPSSSPTPGHQSLTSCFDQLTLLTNWVWHSSLRFFHIYKAGLNDL